MNEQLVDLNEEYNSSCNGCGEISSTFSEGLCRYCYESYVADLAERDDDFHIPAMEDEEEIVINRELELLPTLDILDSLDIDLDPFYFGAKL